MEPLIKLIILVAALALLIYVSVRNPAKNRLTRMLRIIVFLVLVILIAVIAVKEYGPKGNNPIFSEHGRGQNEGTDDKQSYADGGEISGNAVYHEVIVRGFSVIVNGTEYSCADGGFAEVDAVITELAGSGRIRLGEDYGVSSVYHHVLDLLADIGADFEETELE